jgi:phosphoribosylformylglycinamidine synthase
MQARVTVSLKKTVLDPQGQAISNALRSHGHAAIQDVRQGKVFEIQLAPGTSRAEAEDELGRIARDILANPVIEEYRVEILD